MKSIAEEKLKNQILMTKNEFEQRLRNIGAERYHDNCRFHHLLHSGKLNKGQVQAWAINRYYYQINISIKDSALMSRIKDPDLRRIWIKRILYHDGRKGDEGGIERWYKLKNIQNPNSFRLHLMPIAVGMYLPFGLSTPILIAGLLAHFILKENSSNKDPDSVLQKGVLLSSGLIAGESLMGILLAFVAGAGIQSLTLDLNPDLITVLTLSAALGTIWWLYTSSKIKNN